MIKNKLLLSLSFALALTGAIAAYEEQCKPNTFWQKRKLELQGLKHAIAPSWALNPILTAAPCSAGIVYWNEIITTPQNLAAFLLCVVLAPVLLHQIFDTPEKIALTTQKIINDIDNQKIDIDFSTQQHNKDNVNQLINIQKALEKCENALQCSSSEDTTQLLNLLIKELTTRQAFFATLFLVNQIIPKLLTIDQ